VAVTVYDVAKTACVDIGTVSRAITTAGKLIRIRSDVFKKSSYKLDTVN